MAFGPARANTCMGLQVENFLRDSGVVVSCDIRPRLKSGHREPLTRRVLAGHFPMHAVIWMYPG